MVDEMLQAEPAGESATDDGADEWSLSAEQLTAEQAELGAAAAAPSDDAAERFGPVSDAAVAALSPGPASDAPAETTAEVPAIADFDAEDGGAAGEGKPSAELLDACDRALEAAAKVESARQVVERTADQMRGLAEQSTESQEAVRQLQADAEQRSRELYEEIARLRERFSEADSAANAARAAADRADEAEATAQAKFSEAEVRARKAAEEAVGEEIADRLQALQSRHAQSISGLEARVQRSERALESLNDLVAELSARTPALLKPAVAKREASAGSLRLNEASFEDLRACELSVTQAGRVLARREALGGYTALEQLDELPGLPAETLKAFKARISL